MVAPPVLLPHPPQSIPMLLYFAISKAKTHKHAVKRRRLRTKLKGAIDLIVTRGAHTAQLKPGVPQLEFDDEEVRERGDRWILPSKDPPSHCHSNLYRHIAFRLGVYLLPHLRLVPGALHQASLATSLFAP